MLSVIGYVFRKDIKSKSIEKNFLPNISIVRLIQMFYICIR